VYFHLEIRKAVAKLFPIHSLPSGANTTRLVECFAFADHFPEYVADAPTAVCATGTRASHVFARRILDTEVALLGLLVEWTS
jgi:hypothetical protein